MKIELFFQPETRLCAHIEGERCVMGVKPVWAAPLSRSNRYLALLDPKGDDFALLEEPEKELSQTSWAAIKSEIRRRDLTARVSKLDSAREDNGAVYWTAQTDRGQRDFVTNNLSTNAIWFGETRLLLLDTEGNRFEFEDLNALDQRSRDLIEGIL